VTRLKPSENEIAKQVTEWLDWHHYAWHYVPNRGRFDTGQDKKTKGAPDIVICANGLYVAVEFKAQGKKQSGEQEDFQRMIEQKGGGIYVLARDINDLIPVLKKY
jgi:hypothetical protein